MADTPLNKAGNRSTLQETDPEKYALLKAEAAAPFRGLRQFVYIAFTVSGAIGAFVALTQLLAGRDVTNALPNLGIQLGVIALMIWLFRLEGRSKRKSSSDSER